ILVIIKSATMIFFIMQKALNSVWNIELKSKVNYFKVIKHRLITFAIVVGLGATLLLSLFLDAIFIVFSDQLQSLFNDYLSPAVKVVRYLFSIAAIFVFFTIIQRKLPDVKITWEDSIAGGIITSILFLIGKEIINYVLSNIKIIGIYAAAGSLVILLLWVFYSTIILILGAEVTKAYSQYHGRDIIPNSIAVKYKKIHRYES
nr:YihY/virulence factor BrkB family protein [Bacteroidota bacterium]